MGNRSRKSFVLCLLAVFLLLAPTFSAATNQGDGVATTVYEPVELFTPLKNPDMGWVAYSFSPFTDFNPLYSGSTSRYSTTLYSNYFSWRDLEPEEGQYDFSPIHNFVDQWSRYGFSLAIGIHMADATSLPGRVHVPRYIFERVGGKWITSLYGGAFTLPYPTWEPYYWDDFLLQSWGRFLAAFAEEYRRNSEWQEHIQQFDMSSFGQWGEWHTELFDAASSRSDVHSGLYGLTTSQVRQVQVETMERMSKQYTDLFLNRDDGIRYPRLGVNVVYSTVTQGEYVAATNGTLAPGIKNVVETAQIGEIDIFRRFIGGEFYLYGPDRAAILNNWKRLRFHGEWGSATGNIGDGDFGNNTQGNPTTTQQAVQQALDYHSSALGWYVGSVLEGKKLDLAQVPAGEVHGGKEFIAYPGMSLADYYQANCGYRLVLNRVERPSSLHGGQRFSLRQSWSQKGVATIYDKYDLKVYLVGRDGERIDLGVDRTFDARGWVKKENDEVAEYDVVTSHEVPASVPAGWYQFAIAIVDPDTGAPAMNLAVAGKIPSGDVYGCYSLGYVDVGGAGGGEPDFQPATPAPPKKIAYNRPILSRAVRSFSWGEKDVSFVGHAGFEFIADQDLEVYEIGHAVQARADSYPTTFSIVDVADRRVLVSQVFRFQGYGALEYGQLADPVLLRGNRRYAVLIWYPPQGVNLYGDGIETGCLYRSCPVVLSGGSLSAFRAVTSPDGKTVEADDDGAGMSHGVLSIGYRSISPSTTTTPAATQPISTEPSAPVATVPVDATPTVTPPTVPDHTATPAMEATPTVAGPEDREGTQRSIGWLPFLVAAALAIILTGSLGLHRRMKGKS